MLNREQQKRLSEALVALETAKGTIDELTTEVQERYDEMSEKVQEGAKGEALTETIGYLEEASNDAEHAIERLGEAQSVSL